MPEDKYIRARNWHRFQTPSLKRTSMPWVKNFTALLTDPDYLALTPLCRAALHGLWMLWRTTERPLPRCSSYLGAQLAMRSQDVAKALDILEDKKFIQLCSRSSSLYDTSNPRWGATEGEGEREGEGEKRERKKTTGRKAPSAGNGPYRWQGQIIRLNEADYDTWAKAYSHLDLDTELQARDDYLRTRPDAERKKWFCSTSSVLRKRNAEAKEQQEDTKRQRGWAI